MKKRNLIITMIVILLLIALSYGVLYVVNLKDKKTEEGNPTDEIKEIKEEEQPVEEPKDYIYKIKFSFSDDYYITLKQDHKIEVYHKSEIYEVCPNTDCMNPTGRYKEETKEINFKQSTQDRIIEVMTSLYGKAKNNDIDADSIPLTPLELRTLLAVVIEDEDMITIDEDIILTKENKDTKTSTKTIIHHETTNLSTNDNQILQKIAVDLNAKTKKVFEEEVANYEKDIDMYEKSGLEQVNGITKKLNVVYYGPYGISFIYYNSNIESGFITPNDSVKAYYYSYAGTEKQFPAGWKDKYYEKALREFINSTTYLNYHADLLPEWKTILKDNLFQEGNWNLEEGKLVFYIPGSILGIIPLQQPVVIIEVELEEDF